MAKNKEEQKSQSTELLQLVSFIIGNEEFGVDILFVHEINRMLQNNQSSQFTGFCGGRD